MAYLLPLAAMLLSDTALGMTRYDLWVLLGIQPVVYACFLATTALGQLIKDRRSVWQVGAATLAGSLLFYLVTNFAAWATMHGYPFTLRGLADCYVAGLPFFRNTLAGDVGFAAILFGGLAWLESRVAWMRERPAGVGLGRGGCMRVISLLASGTEIVCALGAGDWLVGRSHECDNPPWVAGLPECTRPAFDVSMASGRIDAEVRRRLKAGEPLYHVDTELIHSLKPDLLITQEHCEVCAVTPGDVHRAGCVVAGAGAGAAGRQRAGHLRRHRRDRSSHGPRTGCGQPGRRHERPHGRRPQGGRATIVRRAWSSWSGSTRSSRWATGARSSSRRPTAGWCWARMANTPAPSTGGGCATPIRNG